MKKYFILPAALLFSLTGCAADVGTAQQGLRSCFDTGDGVACISGDDVETQDVDGDGEDDVFLCADAHSDSDSDISGESSGQLGWRRG